MSTRIDLSEEHFLILQDDGKVGLYYKGTRLSLEYSFLRMLDEFESRFVREAYKAGLAEAIHNSGAIHNR